jgi:hypothetical protein
MASLPRPLIALLVATLAAFGLWYVELKPSSSAKGVGSYQSAINRAHQAAKTAGAANARLGSPTATAAAPSSPTTKTATTSKTATTTKTALTTKAATTTTTDKSARAAKPAAKPVSTAQQVSMIENALTSHKVVAVLFYNQAASDDWAMAREIMAVPTHGGKVVKLAVPVSELTSFGVITEQIPVVTAPTLVLIDGSHQATTVIGFADPLEITQRVDDALAAK